jgi:antitoxin component YwqK of YwqJK toxin-antitoxin module
MLSGQTVDASGKKQGYWKKKDDAGKLMYEGEFKNDVPVGKFKYYYPNDSLKATMSFRKDGKSSYARMFHGNGKRMAEGKYVGREMKDSVWTYYDETGTLLSREKYKSGLKDGPAFVYFPDGSISEERNYTDDKQHGPFRQYHDSNKLKASGMYRDGKMEGKMTYFFLNGTEASAGFYKNGERNGPWIYRTDKGEVRNRELYKDGKLASKKETEEFFSKTKTEGVRQK